jgi:hypothetical protein
MPFAAVVPLNIIIIIPFSRLHAEAPLTHMALSYVIGSLIGYK